MTPDQNQGWSIQDPQTVVIPGPFGGQIPVPPIATEWNSTTIPSFQFSQDDFWLPITNNWTTAQTISDNADPFAGWITSLQNTTNPINTSTIIEGNTEVETIPSFNMWSFTTDTVSTTEVIPNQTIEQQTPIIEQTSIVEELTQQTIPSFDMPNISIPHDNVTHTTIETLPEQTPIATQVNNEVNADQWIPSIATPLETPIDNIANETITIENPEVTSTTNEVSYEEKTTEQWTTFSLPTEENIVAIENQQPIVNDNNSEQPLSISTEDNKINEIATESNSFSASTITESTEQKIKEEDNTNLLSNDDGMVTSANEVYQNDTHPILEIYTIFSSVLDKLLTLRNTDTTTIVGHRTNEEEVQYEFNKQNEHTTVIKHHHLLVTDTETSQKLSFNNTNGLIVSLNDEVIGTYNQWWSTNEDSDISYYLKDKLNKLITIIDDEYNQEEKKVKEEKNKKKKYLEILRTF
jgi:hypothetical protein